MYGVGPPWESVFVDVVHVGQGSNPNPLAMSVPEPGGGALDGGKTPFQAQSLTFTVCAASMAPIYGNVFPM